MVGPVWHTKIGVSGPLSAKLLSYAGLICAAADPTVETQSERAIRRIFAHQKLDQHWSRCVI
jgi:hypothetical protein